MAVADVSRYESFLLISWLPQTRSGLVRGYPIDMRPVLFQDILSQWVT